MEITELQKSLKSCVDKYDAIEMAAKAAERDLNDEEKKLQAGFLDKAEALKSQIESAKRIDVVKKFGEAPAGSPVGGSWERTALPGEGSLKDTTVENKSGDMSAKSWYGEEALKKLNDPDYYEAMNEYLHCASTNQPMSKHAADLINGVKNASLHTGMKGNSMKVMNEGSFASGEAWLPPDFRNNLVERLAAPNTVRQNASVFTTGTDMITFPVASYIGDTADDVNGDIYPVGTRGKWQGSSPITTATEATNPIAGNLRIPVNLYTLDIICTREQIEDNAFDLLGWVSKKATEVGILDQEKAYTVGTGLDQPVGFTQHPAFTTAVGSTVKVNNSTYTGMKITSGVSAALTWPIPSDSLDPTTYGLLGMSTNLPTQYEVGAKWFANKKTYGNVMGLTDSNGRPLWYGTDASPFPQFIAGFPASLLGYPVVRNVFMPNVGASAYPMVLGNMGGYFIVDRVGITVEVFRETLAQYDQVLIHLRMRTGGQLVDYYKLRSLETA